MAHIEHDKTGAPFIRNDWHIEDVEVACDNMEVALSYDEKCDVLHRVANSFDANLGIHWEWFYMAIQEQIDTRETAQ